ncbi:MAG: PASTA domain-containing protein [Bacteroidota bacterium]
MSLAKFLVSRTFIRHLAIAAILVVLLVFLTLKALKFYTHHGVSYPVPDFTELTVEEAEIIANPSRLKIAITDSVYQADAKPGTIVDQVPAANSKVKQNRSIFVTINSTQPEKVTLPKLTDISFRQAKVLIENCGLIINNISYQPSEYHDLVLMVEQDSVEVYEGEQLVIGSSIDLTIGRSRGNLETPLPRLIGLLADDAKTVLTDAKLNQGVIIFDKSITTAEDSLNARVWKQQPDKIFTKKVYLGSSVDLWVTVDTVKINEAIKTF